MAKNNGIYWNAEKIHALRQLAAENLSSQMIAVKLGTTPAAIKARASLEGISLHTATEALYTRAPVMIVRRRRGLDSSVPLAGK